MNVELYKYHIKSLEILLRVDESESISIIFKHFEVKEQYIIVEQILDETMKLLRDNEFYYKHSVLFPNPLQISEVISGQSIVNETTEDYYSLVKVDAN